MSKIVLNNSMSMKLSAWLAKQKSFPARLEDLSSLNWIERITSSMKTVESLPLGDYTIYAKDPKMPVIKVCATMRVFLDGSVKAAELIPADPKIKARIEKRERLNNTVPPMPKSEKIEPQVEEEKEVEAPVEKKKKTKKSKKSKK